MLATGLPVMCVAAVLVSRVVADNRVEAERRLLEAARSGAAVVDAELQGTIRALQGLAESDRLVGHNWQNLVSRRSAWLRRSPPGLA